MVTISGLVEIAIGGLDRKMGRAESAEPVVSNGAMRRAGCGALVLIAQKIAYPYDGVDLLG